MPLSGAELGPGARPLEPLGNVHYIKVLLQFCSLGEDLRCFFLGGGGGEFLLERFLEVIQILLSIYPNLNNPEI